MADFHGAFLPVFLLATFAWSGADGQLRQSTHVPDHLEFSEGHAYIGSDSVKREHDKLVFVKRVADKRGKGAFVETAEKLNPTPEAWQRFLERIESLGVWEWKPDYHHPKRDWPDGESRTLTLRCGAKQLNSRGYNAVPEAYGEFCDAVYKLIEEARHHERN